MGRLDWQHSSYLPGVEVNHDQEGGSSKVRLFHCTSVELTLTITPNVGNLNASFLLVGDCVRAIPLKSSYIMLFVVVFKSKVADVSKCTRLYEATSKFISKQNKDVEQLSIVKLKLSTHTE
jgi:hypothetical protein